jgi:hypothetical protein
VARIRAEAVTRGEKALLTAMIIAIIGLWTAVFLTDAWTWV